MGLTGWRRLLQLLVVILLAALAASSSSGSRLGPLLLSDFSQRELDAKARSDARLLRSYLRGTETLMAQLHAHAALWERDKTVALSADERRLALALFEQVLSYIVALDSVAAFNAEFWRIDPLKDSARHARHFALHFAAHAMQVRLGLAFVDQTLNKPQFEKLLDEGSRDHGLPPGAYAQLKWNVVHVEAVTRLTASSAYHEILKTTGYRKLGKDPGDPTVVEMVEHSYDAVKARLRRDGVRLFAGNAFDILRDGGHKAWFPVQAQVAEVLGDTKVHRLETMLISLEQVAKARHKSQPGDILVERRNWYLSNVALPGFWPHSALWVGTPAEMAAFFDSDAEVKKAYGGAFTEALAKKFPRAWQELASLEEGHPRVILEAMSEGVVFTSAEHSIRADYAAAMRPRLSKLEVARAIERAFGYAGRPYDFDFDFYTDKALVCSELIVKAYEPRRGVQGLRFELEEIAGRMTLGPNSMVRQFDRGLDGESAQLEFVWFLDGRERDRSAVWGDLASFRASHQRFKWDIAQR